MIVLVHAWNDKARHFTILRSLEHDLGNVVSSSLFSPFPPPTCLGYDLVI